MGMLVAALAAQDSQAAQEKAAGEDKGDLLTFTFASEASELGDLSPENSRQSGTASVGAAARDDAGLGAGRRGVPGGIRRVRPRWTGRARLPWASPTARLGTRQDSPSAGAGQDRPDSVSRRSVRRGARPDPKCLPEGCGREPARAGRDIRRRKEPPDYRRWAHFARRRRQDPARPRYSGEPAGALQPLTSATATAAVMVDDRGACLPQRLLPPSPQLRCILVGSFVRTTGPSG